MFLERKKVKVLYNFDPSYFKKTTLSLGKTRVIEVSDIIRPIIVIKKKNPFKVLKGMF